jgi:hypothetical protein
LCLPFVIPFVIVVIILAAFTHWVDAEAEAKVELVLAALPQHVEEPLVDGDLVPPMAVFEGEVEAAQRHGEETY